VTDEPGPGVPYVMGSDGSDRRQLLSAAAAQRCPTSHRPAWSPDGSSLALTCFSEDAEQHLGLWVANVEGTQIDQVVDSELVNGGPTWGDDDERIYFINEGVGETPNKVYSVPAAGGAEMTPATDGDASEANPDRGEAGLLYMSRTGTEQNIFLRSDGITKQLTNTGTVNAPTWSPDGKSVAWLAPSRTDDEATRVWVAKFIADRPGSPKLGRHRELDFSGTPGPPGWGSR